MSKTRRNPTPRSGSPARSTTPTPTARSLVPYSNAPGRQPIVLSVGRFSSLAHFDQQAENYQLEAGMYVDREELIARRTAQLILRPQLSVNGMPDFAQIAGRCRLVSPRPISTDVATTKEVPDFKLFADREKVYEFQVPQRLANIHFTLKAKIQNLSREQENRSRRPIRRSRSTTSTARKERPTCTSRRVGRDYVIDLLGKTGEPQPDRAIHLQFKLRDFTQMLQLGWRPTPMAK